MENILNIVYVILALLFLWKGSDWLVDSSVRIAHHLGVSQLVIGLTIVALGTSAPEFVVTIGAAIGGQSDISVSNIVGSNIFNLGFILGGVAIIQTIECSKSLIWRDGLVLIGATIAVLLMLWDAQFSRFEAIILFAGLVVYNIFLFIQKHETDLEINEGKSKGHDVLMLVVSLACIIVGGRLLLTGSVGIARALGISEWVIGATIVAAGTSVPEFATSLVASLKGQHGISAGNLVGSCVYNTLGVLGLAGILRPMKVAGSAKTSIGFLLFLVILSIVLLRTHQKLKRWEGIALVLVATAIWIIQFV